MLWLMRSSPTCDMRREADWWRGTGAFRYADTVILHGKIRID